MPRAGLTTDVVVEAAARLADEAGWDQLTLAALAERFGVAVPSLYKHIGGLEDLRHRVAALAVRELGAALGGATVGQDRRGALRAMAAAYRRFAAAHPGRYAATLRAPRPADAEHVAAAEAVLATVFEVLAGYGLHGDDVVHATRLVRSALHGFASLEATGGFGMPQDIEETYAGLVDALDSVLSDWGSAGEQQRRTLGRDDRRPVHGS